MIENIGERGNGEMIRKEEKCVTEREREGRGRELEKGREEHTKESEKGRAQQR